MAESTASSAASPKAGKATIKNGVYGDKVDAGSSVGDARKKMIALNGMASDTTAYIDNKPVGDDHVLQAGDTLTFLKRSGEKG